MYMCYVHLGPHYISARTEILARLRGLKFQPASEINPLEIKLAITWRRMQPRQTVWKIYLKKKYHEYRNFIPGSKASLYEHSDFTFIRVFDPDADISLRAETKTTKFRLGLQFVT